MTPVTFFGGIADPSGTGNDLPVPIEAAHPRADGRIFVTLQHRYPCGHVGYDAYELQGVIALFAYHVPAPEHRGTYTACR